MNNINFNFRRCYSGVIIRVVCCNCGEGGAQYMESCQPKCHVCGNLMQPACNDEIVCDWETARKLLKEIT